MSEPSIRCPRCDTQIPLTESLAAPLLASTKQQYEQKMVALQSALSARERALQEGQRALETSRADLDAQIAERLTTERAKIAEEENRKARTLLSTELEERSRQVSDLQSVLEERNAKLAEAQKVQAELLRKQRELDDARRELDLTVEKRVQDGLAAVREEAVKAAEDALRLKVAEREQTIASMQRQIEELKRKAEQGSQQLQGEVQELELEALLLSRFPSDTIQSVPKGEFGGDVIQFVVSPLGQSCGAILWESKRTKNWNDQWLAKLRDDQRAAKADIAILISAVMPKEFQTFDLVEGVWVAAPRYAIPLAVVLRQSLLELSRTRAVGEGQQTKMELVYQYLTGPRFRHRVQAIVEKFSDMREDLDRERKLLMKQWAKREEQIRCVLEATAGMYGDLQGIAGKSIQEIEALDIALLEHDDVTEGCAS